MSLVKGHSGAVAHGGGRLAAVTVRQVGRRLGWAEDLRALLSGRAVLEAEPEALALERALAAFRQHGAQATIDEITDLCVAVSHDGGGPERGVTVTISALLRGRPCGT